MKLHNIDYYDLDDEELDSLFIPHKEPKIKRMKNPQVKIKTKKTSKNVKPEE
jgi:hypothetical protein